MRHRMIRAICMLVLTAALLLPLPRVLAQPEQTYTTEHFSITWPTDPEDPGAPDLSDVDADGVPDAVERMAAAFETARAFELGDLGYKEPPVEGLYPLYVADIAEPGTVDPAPGGTGGSRPSFAVIDSKMVQMSIDDEAMAAFAAHEYFHAIQLGYDADEERWIQEATATWIEDLYVDAADTNHDSLGAFAPFPRVGLESTGSDREYGAFLFVQFLTERYGGGSRAGADLVKELWEEMAVPEAIEGAPNRDPLGALDAVLARRGASLAEAWSEFLLWQWRLGRFEEGAAYKQALAGTSWRTLLRSTKVKEESCRLTTDKEEARLPRLSGDYVTLVPDRRAPGAASARLTVEGPPGSGAFALLKPTVGPVQEFLLTFGPDGVGSIDVPFGTQQTRRLIVGLANGSVTPLPATIAYSLQLGGANEVDASDPTGATTTSFGVGVSLSGTVTCSKLPAAFADVVVTETELVSGAQRTFTAQANARGAWSAIVDPQANATYSVEVVDPLLSPDVSGRHQVAVTLFVTIALPEDKVELGEPVVVSGTVTPIHARAPLLLEFRRPERPWQVGPATTVNADGSYSAEIVLPRDGIWEIRARVTATTDDDHEPGQSLTRLVRVRA